MLAHPGFLAQFHDGVRDLGKPQNAPQTPLRRPPRAARATGALTWSPSVATKVLRRRLRTRPLGRAETERGGAARSRYWTWAALMCRAFDLDVVRPPRGADRMELIATIDDPAVIHCILAPLALRSTRDGPALAVSSCEPTSRRSPSRSRRDVAGPPARAVVRPYPRRAMVSGVRRPASLTTPTRAGRIAPRRQGRYARCAEEETGRKEACDDGRL